MYQHCIGRVCLCDVGHSWETAKGCCILLADARVVVVVVVAAVVVAVRNEGKKGKKEEGGKEEEPSLYDGIIRLWREREREEGSFIPLSRVWYGERREKRKREREKTRLFSSFCLFFWACLQKKLIYLRERRAKRRWCSTSMARGYLVTQQLLLREQLSFSSMLIISSSSSTPFPPLLLNSFRYWTKATVCFLLLLLLHSLTGCYCKKEGRVVVLLREW